MQKLKIEHKNITIDQKQQVVSSEEKKDRRPGKGRCIALSRKVFRILNSDVYYIESETSDNIYYFVKFKPDVFEWWCSCPDNSTRHVKCKHLFSIEFAIKWGTIKDIDKLPAEAKRYGAITVSKPYEEDDYDF